MFQHQYLTSLGERDTGKDANVNINVGDVILIKKIDAPRNEWTLGRIQRLVYSDDNTVRGAALKTKSGILKRPINLLYPLEIRHQGEDDTEDGKEQNSSPAQSNDCDHAAESKSSNDDSNSYNRPR